MWSRAPVVTFKKKVFDEWMDIFANYDWQKDYSKHDIREAFDFLKTAYIKEIDVRHDSIILRYFNPDKSIYFVMIEYIDGKLDVRTSIQSDIKVAISALLAFDEVLLEKQHALLQQQIEHPNENTEDDDEESSPITPGSKAHKDGTANNTPSDLIKLSFYMAGQTLCFRAYWNSSNKLLFPEILSKRSHKLTKDEKNAVVKLIHLSRKYGFKLNHKSKEYQLSNVFNAMEFCKATLPKWEQYFIIIRDENVKKLLNTPVEVNTVFKVTKQNSDNTLNNSIHIDLQVSANNFTFSDNIAQKILKSNGNHFFVDGYGTISIKKEKIQLIHECHSIIQKFNGQIPRYMLYSIFNQSSLTQFEDSDLEEWKASFNAAPSRSFLLPKTLRTYQKDGVMWINHILKHGFHGLLADDMGLGKTLQVLTFISKMDAKHQTVVVCPASVVDVWKNEAEKFYPKLKVRIFNAFADLDEPDVNIWVVSYTQLRRNKSEFTKKHFQLVVLDEAQFIKNSTTKVFHACIALKSQWRLALSGTPIENNLLDLWSIFRFLMPGLLCEKKAFIDLINLQEDITDKIKKQIAPFMLRRTKDSVAQELPEKIEINIPCEMTQLQQTLYKKVIKNTLTTFSDKDNHLDVKKHRFGILSALTRLRQVACDPGIVPGVEAEFEDSCKLAQLNELLTNEFSAERTKKVVIFSQFVSFLKRIRQNFNQKFPNIKVFEIIGSTRNRNQIVQDFQTVDSDAIILVSLKAGGVGITLTAAESVYIMDPWWNPSTEKQAMDRVHRIGQNKTVSVYKFISQNSIESHIQAMQNRKNYLFGEIIDSLKIKQDGVRFFLQNVEELLKQDV